MKPVIHTVQWLENIFCPHEHLPLQEEFYHFIKEKLNPSYETNADLFFMVLKQNMKKMNQFVI